jgi:hypothetical protein
MERFLDMHMYITSALQKTDMKAVGLQLALDLLHKQVCNCPGIGSPASLGVFIYTKQKYIKINHNCAAMGSSDTV